MVSYTIGMAYTAVDQFGKLPANTKNASPYFQPLSRLGQLFGQPGPEASKGEDSKQKSKKNKQKKKEEEHSGQPGQSTQGGAMFTVMRDTIEVAIDQLVEKRQNLVRLSGLPRSNKIPAVCLREVRMWCTLNAHKFRNILQRPEMAFGELIQYMKNLIPSIDITPDNIPDDDPIKNLNKARRLGGTSKECKYIDRIQPMIFFVCSGLGLREEVGTGFIAKEELMPMLLKTIHNFFSIGTTQERLDSWPSYNKIRRDARDQHLGDKVQEDWATFYHKLMAFDRALVTSGKEQSKGRGELAYHALKGLNPPEELKDLPGGKNYFTALRTCVDHIGLPYNQMAGGMEVAGCCYGCKVSIRYREAMSDEDLREDIIGTDEAVKVVELKDNPEIQIKKRKPGTVNSTDLGNRIATAHSCAEVPVSGYCCHPAASHLGGEMDTASGRSKGKGYA
ncbi:hypothetical protein FGRMN_8601 [Fusarium graminum]|nr:hypothetical protein FGRMN_8601 [Fusarium graminum]